MGGRPEPEYTLRRVMSREQTHDKQKTNYYKHTIIGLTYGNSRQKFTTKNQNCNKELLNEE